MRQLTLSEYAIVEQKHTCMCALQFQNTIIIKTEFK